MAIDLDAPAHVPGVLRSLEHADAHAVAFRGLKGPEQALAHESFAHAASGIGNFDHRVPAFGPDADSHFPRLLRGVDGVLQQMAENALETLLVAEVRHPGVGG